MADAEADPKSIAEPRRGRLRHDRRRVGARRRRQRDDPQHHRARRRDAVVYWLAEQYAHALAHSLAGHRADAAQVARGLREGWPMVQASYLPVGVLIVAWLLGFDTNTSVNLALTACVLVLFVLGWRGGMRRGLLLRGRIYSSLIAGSFGVAVVRAQARRHALTESRTDTIGDVARQR